VTFDDQLETNRDTEAEMARALRAHEAALAADMRRQIAQTYGDKK
jgi:hypothetical protein